jgi:hypothetical protein
MRGASSAYAGCSCNCVFDHRSRSLASLGRATGGHHWGLCGQGAPTAASIACILCTCWDRRARPWDQRRGERTLARTLSGEASPGDLVGGKPWEFFATSLGCSESIDRIAAPTPKDRKRAHHRDNQPHNMRPASKLAPWAGVLVACLMAAGAATVAADAAAAAAPGCKVRERMQGRFSGQLARGAPRTLATPAHHERSCTRPSCPPPAPAASSFPTALT